MTNTQLKMMKKFSEKNVIYNEKTKKLTINKGRMAGTYLNIKKYSALELINAN